MNLQELNDSQREAVLCTDAPMLVIAGAGSGKTRVLTYKIAYLLTQGYEPWQILALTFTNKAAREMQTRIAAQVGQEQAASLWMGTFHSIFCRILRIEAERIGFRPDFTIYDAADSKVLVTAIIKDMNLDAKQYKASQICSLISRFKNSHEGLTGIYHDIYNQYCARCRQANAMDFDDILLYTWELFSKNHDIAERYQNRFRYILVDEYQDTNLLQDRIVWLLSEKHKRVCVVGDDAQSIYSFRGANINNILNFVDRYKKENINAVEFKLLQNYRSTENIVKAANSLILHNYNQIAKEVYSQNGQGDLIELKEAVDDGEEAVGIVLRLRQFARENHIPYSQMAVLYRTNSQSRRIEEIMRRELVPYRIYGGLSFYQRKEVKDIIAYFRLAVNPNDEVSLKRVINYPARKIGNTTVDKILSKAQETGLTPWQVLSNPLLLDVNSGTRTRLQAFHNMIMSFNEDVNSVDAFTLGSRILEESGIKNEFSGKSPENIASQEYIQELFDGINVFVRDNTNLERGVNLGNYLQEVSLLSDIDEDDSQSEDKVTLMTIHSAKGLEFDAVIVCGMEEGLFPSEQSVNNPQQIEEERRLFYVAMTRARNHLVLTYAKERFRYGTTERYRPSRFLTEIDSRYLKILRSAGSCFPFEERGTSIRRPASFGPSITTRPLLRKTQTPPPSPSRFVRLSPTQQTSSPAASATTLNPGDRIAHDRFGEGVVVSIEGTGLDTKARVNFDNAGEKQLLLRFAKFKVL